MWAECKLILTDSNGNTLIDSGYGNCDGCAFVANSHDYPFINVANGTSCTAKMSVALSFEKPKFRTINSETCLIAHGSVDSWKFDYFGIDSSECRAVNKGPC